MRHIKKTILAAGAVAAAIAYPALAIDISGAGATFPYPIYAKWADAYKKETGNGLNYQSIGSGGGIKQITAKTVTFGASDMPLKPEELDEERPRPVPDRDGRRCSGREPRRHQVRRPHARRPDARQDFPRRDQDLGRSGDPEAQPQRQAAVAGRSSSCIVRTARAPPSSAPIICRRSARTGSRRSAPTPSVEWPVGIGAKGNEGVANNVANTKGSIGYVEYAYAKQNKLTTTKHDQQGRQDGRAERKVVPGRRGQRRLGEG